MSKTKPRENTMKTKIFLSLALSTVVIMGAAEAAKTKANTTAEIATENASAVAAIVEKVSTRFSQLADYFQTNVADINKVFHELNGQGAPADTSPVLEFTEATTSEGGHLTCVKEGVIVADSDPTQLGKDANTLIDANGKLIFKDIVTKLEKSGDEKVTAYYSLPTDVKNPSDNSKTLNRKLIFVVWGRKALLGSKLEKKNHEKFACYISQPVQ